MSGVIGGGAVSALEELGLTESFDEIYTVSAGFPNALYFLSKQTKLGTSIYYEDLNDRKFVNFSRFYRPINFLLVVNTILKDKILNLNDIKNNSTKLFVKVKNFWGNDFILDAGKEFLNNPQGFLSSVISQRFISRGGKIRNQRFYDGQFLPKDNHRLIDVVLSKNFSDILVIYNRRRQKIPKDIINKNVFEILPPIDVGHFETNADKLKNAAELMRKQVLSIFNNVD